MGEFQGLGKLEDGDRLGDVWSLVVMRLQVGPGSLGLLVVIDIDRDKGDIVISPRGVKI